MLNLRFLQQCWRAFRSASDNPVIKGPPRPYQDAIALGVIEERIRALVAVMNIPGVVETVASCEGHRFRNVGPYVAYRSDNDFACRLERRIRADEQSQRPTLAYYWTNRAYISSDFELIFTLSAPAIDSGKQTLCRGRLDSDFRILASMVKEAVQDGGALARIGDDTRRSDDW